MSDSNNKLSNEPRHHPRVHFGQYLFNPNEPKDVKSNDVPRENEYELRENSNFMRQQFRHKATLIRSRYY